MVCRCSGWLSLFIGPRVLAGGGESRLAHLARQGVVRCWERIADALAAHGLHEDRSGPKTRLTSGRIRWSGAGAVVGHEGIEPPASCASCDHRGSTRVCSGPSPGRMRRPGHLCQVLGSAGVCPAVEPAAAVGGFVAVPVRRVELVAGGVADRAVAGFDRCRHTSGIRTRPASIPL